MQRSSHRKRSRDDATWTGKLFTWSTKRQDYTFVCDLSSDAPDAASLPATLKLTFCPAAPALDRLGG